MRVIAQPADLGTAARPVALALGVFDGIHLGHQAVIGRTVNAARELDALALVVTFDRHPNAVVAPERTPPSIQSLDQRLRAIAALGADATWVIRFDEAFSRLSGEQFARDLALGFGQLRLICVGAGFAFGHRRSGNVALLERLGGELSFRTEPVPPVSLDGETVSSTRIREAIRAGEITTAERLLGRRYAISGRVVKGDQIGRQLGFPTANLDTAGLVLPPNGVYAVRVVWRGCDLPGVMNIGVRPTVASQPEQRVEVHVLDSEPELYGEQLEAMPVAKLREECRFASREELQAQIARDVAAARNMFDGS